MAHNIMRKFKIDRIAAVTKPAQQGALAVIMKRDTTGERDEIISKKLKITHGADGKVTIIHTPETGEATIDKGDGVLYIGTQAEFDALPAAVLTYLKRDFSTQERRDAAAAGQALPDGSFPIKDRSDLENAIRAIGRAKDPAKAKSHIIARARALDATSLLPADWKAAKSIAGDLIREIARVAPRALPELLENINKAEAIFDRIEAIADKKVRKALGAEWQVAKEALVATSWSVLDETSPDDAASLLQKNFAEYKDHVANLLEPGHHRAAEGDAIMLKVLAKKLGLTETATEAEINAALEKADLLAARNAKIAKLNGKSKAYFDTLKSDTERDEFLGKAEADQAKIVKAAKKTKGSADDEDDEDGEDGPEDCMKLATGEVIRKSVVGDATFAFMKAQAEKVEKMETDAAVGVIAKRVEPLKFVIGKADDTAAALHRVKVGKSTSADAALIEDLLTKANTLIGKSDQLTKEFGASGGQGQFAKAADAIEAKAKELISKGEKDGKGRILSIEKARDKARQMNPELAQQEETERKEARRAA